MNSLQRLILIPYHFLLHQTDQPTHLSLTIGEGKGYIQGKRFELTGTTRLPLAKATTTANADPQQVSINYGNYVDVDELVGQFGAEENDMVLILDTAMNSISANVNSTLPAASNTSVAYNLSLIHI